MRARRIAEGAAILLVAAAYVFFATGGRWRFEPAPAQPHGWDNPGRGYYAQLAEGFLRGDTYFPLPPDPRMAALPDPYDYGARDRAGISYLWDASWYGGKYYLYFTPLPVVLFYLPFRAITGVHANDTLAAAFFSFWIFLAAVVFLRRAGVSRMVWLLFVGLANLLPFALSSARVYEVAILCATAFSTTWAASLLRFQQQPSARAAAWMASWLALAIMARPNLIVLLLPTAFVLWRRGRRVLLAAAIPFAVAACGYFAYNFARFGNVLESGISYQLTYVSMRGVSVCSLCSGPELFRFADHSLQYVFTPPALSSEFPHAAAATAHIDRQVSWPGGEPEEIIGIAPLAPLVMAATLIALVRRRSPGALLLGGGWLVLFALSTCWWIVSRYVFDFQILMLLGTVVCIEEGLAAMESRFLRVIAVLLALYSIALCILLGFEGRGGAFSML